MSRYIRNGLIGSLMIVFSLFFLVACHATPEQIAVSSKTTDAEQVVRENDNTLEQTEPSTEEPKASTFYQTPERYTNEFSQSNVNLYVDAKINGPEDHKIVSVVLEDKIITQEMVDDFLNYFIGDKKLYVKSGYRRSQDQVNAEIVYWEEAIFNCETKWEEVHLKDPYAAHEDKQSAIKEFEKFIKELKRELREAPESIDYSETSRELNEEFGIAAYAQTNEDSFDEMAYIVITDAFDEMGTYLGAMIYENFGKRSASNMTPEQIEQSTGLTLESAVAQAAEVANHFGCDAIYLEGYQILSHFKDGESHVYYDLDLTPAINGIGMPELGNDSQLGFDAGSMSAAPRPEGFRACVDDTGVISFAWEHPKTKISEVDEDVEIMDFDSIIDIFEQKILYTLYMDGDAQREVHINNITLSLMPVKKMNSPQTVLVPVWDFRGYYFDPNDEVWRNSANVKGESDYFSFLTLNAIDGSIIDRNKGY